MTPPAVTAGKQRIYFLPDCVMVEQGSRMGAVAYRDIRIDVRQIRFIESSPPPTDARIVDETWAHPNKDGGPDRRFRNNRLLPVCLYEDLGIIGSTGLKALLEFSRIGVGPPVEQAINQMAAISRSDEPDKEVLLIR